MAKTGANFNSSSKKRNASGSAPREPQQIAGMNKTAQNFMQKKATAGKAKLPPRATMSPAVNSLKSRQLGSSNVKPPTSNLLASQMTSNATNNSSHPAMINTKKPNEIESPIKGNIYFAH